MSEHKKNAEWLLRRASHYRESGGIELAKACAQAAQAEATLALVEQQRVENLIALSTAATQVIRTDLGLCERREGRTDGPLPEPPSWVLLPNIAEALGLDAGAML